MIQLKDWDPQSEDRTAAEKKTAEKKAAEKKTPEKRTTGGDFSERRQKPRTQVMFAALVDLVPVTILDLSFDGLGGVGQGNLELIADGESELADGQEASLRFLDYDDHKEDFPIEIVRISRRSGKVGARFGKLSAHQNKQLEKIFAAACLSEA